MQYIAVAIFIIVYIFFDKSLGFSIGSPFYTHITYMFQHASIIHLVLNSLAFISFYRVLKSFVKGLMIQIIFISFLVSFYSVQILPTVGCSGMVYAMIGMYFALLFHKVFKADVLNVAVPVVVSLAFSFFNAHSNFKLHIMALALGFIFIMFDKILRYETNVCLNEKG